MKFVCGHCKAKYQLADEKIAGRTLRMTCRSCGQEIVIRADPSQASSAGGVPAPMSTPPPGTRASLVGAPPRAPSGLLAPPAPLGARTSIAMSRPVHPPPPPSPLGADFRAAGTPAPAAQMGPPDEWHVAIDDQPLGPIHRDEVARKIAAGALGPDSLAWREGLDDWMPIHDIPELYVLCRRAGSGPVAPLPPSAIGGRGGAAPGMTVEDWAPLHERSAPPAPLAGFATPAAAPTPVTLSQPDLSALRGTRMPSLPVLFALMGGFAFLMSLVAILGARFLARDATAAAPVATSAPVVQPVAPQEQEPKEMVIELEEQVLEEEVSGKPRSSGARSSTSTGTKAKKELTDAQKAMLARMGGEGADLSGLSSGKTEQPSAPARGGGSLTAAELSSVVNRNKKQLQRCYEVALRGGSSDDTVRLDVSITIAPSGGVSAVQLGGQGLPGMNECIQRTVKSWRFPSASEASATRFPLLFQPGA